MSTFGTEAFFFPADGIPLTTVLPEYMGVLDYDKIKEMAGTSNRIKIGTIYGGIESTAPATIPPHFDSAQTDATSRLIDVYLTF